MKTAIIILSVILFCSCITVNKYYYTEPTKEITRNDNMFNLPYYPQSPITTILPYNQIQLPTSPTAKQFCDSIWKLKGNSIGTFTLSDCRKQHNFKTNK